MSDKPMDDQIRSRVHRTLPDQAYLRECFAYDPETGALTWKHRPCEHFPTYKAWRIWLGRFAGTVAGGINLGYVTVSIGNRRFRAHRIIWRLMTDHDPGRSGIDHVNTDRSDNRWLNLRLATQTQNMHNLHIFRRSNAGLKGVAIDPRSPNKPFTARIRINGKRHSLGNFTTAEAAHQAYCVAARKHFGAFMRAQ